MMELRDYDECLEARRNAVMDEYIKQDWEHDKTNRCPFCGNEDFEWSESDDGFHKRTHWFSWRCFCTRCWNAWYIEYDLVRPRVYKEEV